VKIYLPGVRRFSIVNDGYLNVDIEMVTKKDTVGFDEKGFWVEVGEPAEIQNLRKRILELKGYKTDSSNDWTLGYSR
jgi:hypothetical protein